MFLKWCDDAGSSAILKACDFTDWIGLILYEEIPIQGRIIVQKLHKKEWDVPRVQRYGFGCYNDHSKPCGRKISCWLLTKCSKTRCSRKRCIYGSSMAHFNFVHRHRIIRYTKKYSNIQGIITCQVATSTCMELHLN